jgi:translation initiation factor 2B subunit (eIF-2B alpha/beta/delta family)
VNSSIIRAIADVTADNMSGAAEIAERAADILLRQTSSSTALSSTGIRQELLATGRTIIRAHPTMAPLVNLVNTLLWRTDQAETREAAGQMIVDLISDFKRRLRVHEAAIAESTLTLIPEGTVLLTNGRSSTVRAALLMSHRAGRSFRVFCAEGRPGCEGRMMARELAEAGVAVTLVTDALALAKVPETQCIMVGADYVTSDWLVNKVGTRGIAQIAQAEGIPLYALCSSEKFLPHGYEPPHQEQHPAVEVWDEAPPAVQIENWYFDYTPLHLVTGIVSEQGVHPTAGIEAWIAAIQVHRALVAIT